MLVKKHLHLVHGPKLPSGCRDALAIWAACPPSPSVRSGSFLVTFTLTRCLLVFLASLAFCHHRITFPVSLSSPFQGALLPIALCPSLMLCADVQGLVPSCLSLVSVLTLSSRLVTIRREPLYYILSSFLSSPFRPLDVIVSGDTLL